jgi:cbb3-type cytochrome oxidase maturation protein
LGRRAHSTGGQFDDLDGPAVSVIADDDRPPQV